MQFSLDKIWVVSQVLIVKTESYLYPISLHVLSSLWKVITKKPQEDKKQVGKAGLDLKGVPGH